MADNYLFPMSSPDRHFACRVNDRVTWAGMRAVILQNELIQVVILAEKGSEIIQFLHKPTDTDFLWHSSKELHNPAAYPQVFGTDAAPFFDHWSGGWFEALPNNGWSATYKNAPMGFFGETLNVPWETKILEDTPQRVSIGFYFKTYRTPLVIQKVLTIESMKPVLFINEQITNIGGEELEFAWGHHPVVGAPFLDHTCRLSMAECMVEVYHDEDGPGNRMALHQKAPWPEIKDVNGNPLDLRVIPGPESNSIDNCYLAGFKDEAFCAVTNPGKKVGFGLAWNHKVFRYFWLWQAFGGGDGWPWYHNSYQMAIEPWTSYPCTGIEDIIKRGTTVKIKPGESISSWISAVAYVGDRDVSSIKKDGTVTFSS